MMNKVFWINPKRIKYVLREQFNIKEEFSIISGDWDLNILEFENYPVFKGCYELFVENKLWKDTILYKEAVKLINKGMPQWMYKTENEFVKRELEIRSLYDSIIKNEITEQRKICKDFPIWNPDGDFKDEITIAIGRNGELLFFNGFHRTSIAKILNLSKIPVRIVRIHSLWDNFCKDVEKLCQDNWGDRISYHPISHISFYEYSQQWSRLRFEVIKQNISQGKTLLDIGSLFGHFSCEFEDLSFKCTAVENYKPFLEILSKVKNAGYYEFELFSKSIFELEKFEFDVVLGLNIFHHFLKNKNDFDNLKLFLQRLKTKEMFVQLHDKNDFQMKNAYKNFDTKEFLDFICENVKLKNTKELYQENNRKLFKIY